jgi:serine/threonine protein kinase
MSDFATVDNYIIGRELGRGGFGIVKLVTDSQTGEQFAMKLMKSEGSADSIARFHEFVNTEVAIHR